MTSLTLSGANIFASRSHGVCTHADLLYKAKIRGRDGLIYTVFEHQSTSDWLMLLRLLGYVVRVLDQYVRDNKCDQKDMAMTLAEQWRQEGREEGCEEGALQAERLVVTRLLGKKFGELPSSVLERIEAAPEKHLLAWTERVLEAATLEEVLS